MIAFFQMALQLADSAYLELLGRYSTTSVEKRLTVADEDEPMDLSDVPPPVLPAAPISLMRISTLGISQAWLLRSFDWELVRQAVNSGYIQDQENVVDDGRVLSVLKPLYEMTAPRELNLFRDLTQNKKHGISCIAFDSTESQVYQYQFQHPLLQAGILDRMAWAILNDSESGLSPPQQIMPASDNAPSEMRFKKLRLEAVINWQNTLSVFCQSWKQSQSVETASQASQDNDGSVQVVLESLMQASKSNFRVSHLSTVESNFCDAAIGLRALLVVVRPFSFQSKSVLTKLRKRGRSCSKVKQNLSRVALV